MNHQQLVDAIGQADFKKEFLKLPKFYGISSKDTVTASEFLERVENAARAAGWNDVTTVSTMRLQFLEDAALWFTWARDNNHPDWMSSFNAVATDFILRFEPHIVGMRTLASIKDLVQKENESVARFRDRLGVLAMRWRQAAPLPEASETVEQRTHARLGMRAMTEYMLLTHFIMGLREKFRLEVLKKCPSTVQEAVDTALDLEAGMANFKHGAEEPIAPRGRIEVIEDFEEMDEDAQIEAIQKALNGLLHCWYCKKKGHRQDKCFTRIRRRAPLVGFDGKTRKTKDTEDGGVKAVEGDEAEELVSSVTLGHAAPLNCLGDA